MFFFLNKSDAEWREGDALRCEVYFMAWRSDRICPPTTARTYVSPHFIQERSKERELAIPRRSSNVDLFPGLSNQKTAHSVCFAGPFLDGGVRNPRIRPAKGRIKVAGATQEFLLRKSLFCWISCHWFGSFDHWSCGSARTTLSLMSLHPGCWVTHNTWYWCWTWINMIHEKKKMKIDMKKENTKVYMNKVSGAKMPKSNAFGWNESSPMKQTNFSNPEHANSVSEQL